MGKKDAARAGSSGAKAKAAAHDSSSSGSGSSSGGSRVQHPSAKQQRKKGDEGYKKSWSAFNAQLRPFGVCLRSIGGDGNCLFRALADQMSGSQERHAEYRAAVVDYMRRHPADFAPFVWETTFDQYCAKMARGGEWGGAAELAAAGRCYAVHIAVHQYNAPRLLNVYDPLSVTVDPHGSGPCDPPLPVTRDTRTIHLAYHDGEHYSSVRNISDANSSEPATPIVIVEGAGAAASSSSSSASASLTQQETIVMQSTSCKNLAKVRQLLRENWNDADAVVEILYAEVAMGLDVDVSTHTTTQHNHTQRMRLQLPPVCPPSWTKLGCGALSVPATRVRCKLHVARTHIERPHCLCSCSSLSLCSPSGGPRGAGGCAAGRDRCAAARRGEQSRSGARAAAGARAEGEGAGRAEAHTGCGRRARGAGAGGARGRRPARRG